MIHLDALYLSPPFNLIGSGDSTLPSPLPTDRRKLQQGNNAHEHEPIIFSYSTIHPRTGLSHLEPPSPNTLTERLNTISPRHSWSPSTPPFLDSASDSSTPSPPPEMATKDSAVFELPIRIVSPSPPSSSSMSSLPAVVDAYKMETESARPEPEDDDEDALKESIKSVFRLWKVGRRRGATPPAARDDGAKDREDKELFLRIVQEVIRES